MSTETPITDALIDRVMRKHPGVSARAQADYYEAVHQELAPLARDFEKRIARLNADISSRENNQKDWHLLVIWLGCMFDFDTLGSIDEVAVSAAARRDANTKAKEEVST